MSGFAGIKNRKLGFAGNYATPTKEQSQNEVDKKKAAFEKL